MSFVFSHPLLGPDSPLSKSDQMVLAELMAEEDAACATRHLPAMERQTLSITRLPQDIAAALDSVPPELRLLAGRRFRKAYLVGSGSGLAAAQSLRPLFEEMLAGTPCEPIDCTEFAYYARQAIDADSLVIILATAQDRFRILEAALAARSLGATMIALSAGGDERLQQLVPFGLFHPSPDTMLTGTSLLLALAYRLGLALGAIQGIANARLRQLDEALGTMPEDLSRALSAPADIEIIAERLQGAQRIAVIGNGAARGVATASAEWIGTILGRSISVCGIEDSDTMFSDPSAFKLLIVPNGLSVRRAQHILDRRRNDVSLARVVAEDSPLRMIGAGPVVPMPAMIERLSALVYLAPAQRIASALLR